MVCPQKNSRICLQQKDGTYRVLYKKSGDKPTLAQFAALKQIFDYFQSDLCLRTACRIVQYVSGNGVGRYKYVLLSHDRPDQKNNGVKIMDLFRHINHKNTPVKKSNSN